MTQSILAIDDSPDTHVLLAARLRAEGLPIHRADDGMDGIKKARQLQPDLILLDVNMPEFSGFEVCRALKSDPQTAAIPVIFLTGASEVFVKVEGFDLGAVDYITKPFDPAELRARVRAALRTKRYHDLLAARAEIDALTGLRNRAYFDRRVAEGIATAQVAGGSAAVIMIDVDHFKAVNDKHGHPAGDAVLQRVAETLTAQTRGDDVVCRYGGEEFGVVLGKASASDAMAAANRLHGAIGRMVLAERTPALSVTVSVGVAATELFAPVSALTPATLVCAADRALYQAKQSGRDRVCLAPRVSTQDADPGAAAASR